MWIPLMDYAMKKGVSLSTLRRYIKANKVQYRVESGKYLLFCEDDAEGSIDADASGATPARVGPTMLAETGIGAARDAVARLERELVAAREEIAELKMLVAIYEEKLSRTQRLDC